MNSDIDSDARKDPDRLEREIDAQRHEIDATLRALEEKFSSRELANQFMHYFGGPGRQWVESLAGSVKTNPVPTLLTAIGVAWLMIGERNGAHRPPYAYGSGDDAQRTRGRFEDATSSMRDAAHTMKQKAGELGDRAADAGEALGEKSAHARDALRSHASHARDGLQHSATSVRDNFAYMAREQPLALGAVGIALGALLGAALPRTEQEQRVMGRASERMREKGMEMARESYDTAARKAAEMTEKAGESPPS